MKESFLFLTCVLVFSSGSVYSQTSYPFKEYDKNNDIVAYWYNVPEDSVTLKMMGRTFKFQSSLQIYGRAPGESFAVKAEVYSKAGKKVFSETFDIDKGNPADDFNIQHSDGFFKLEKSVKELKENPGKIHITIKSSKNDVSNEVICRYHRLYGKITDFNGRPFKGFVAIRPDAFSFSTAVWSDSMGNYEVYLPERTYNNFAVDNESYGINTAEAWAWHIIMDSDQRLDFKVGTGEIYNLKIWANNGGGNTYFISFRPMTLHLFKNMNQKLSITIENKEYNLIDLDPKLEVADVTVKINGRNADIISLQRYYETVGEDAMASYLVQVSRDNHSRSGKQTIMVEYDNEMMIDGNKVKNSSIGYYQTLLNYSGLSTYF